MIVLCVVGSCGLRLEEIGGRPKLEINEGSLLEKATGSILEKVKAALKKDVSGVEGRSREEIEGGGGAPDGRRGGDGRDGGSPGGKGGGDGKEKEVGERGDERRKKKKRNCRGKTKGTAFKVSCSFN